MALVVTSTITATAEIYLGKQVIFFQEEKRCFYRTKLIRKSRNSYTAAPHLKQNPPDCVWWEGDAVHRLKSLFFLFRFFILQCARIYSSHGIFKFLPLFHTKVRWTLTTVPDSIIGFYLYLLRASLCVSAVLKGFIWASPTFYTLCTRSNAIFLPGLITSATRCFFPLGASRRGASGGRSKVSKWSFIAAFLIQSGK